ncbi:MAG: formylglycine-generating enzyme family protein [Zoogloeaceae bacterium]|nr:formylglycine-generating enzyme family protein [Zoogloeaceae bacterium]
MRKALFFFALCVVSASAGATAYAAPSGSEPPKTYTNSIGMEFVEIPAGSFERELENGEGFRTEFPNDINKVLFGAKAILSKPFYLGKYEVTQEQWAAVMGNNPSTFQGQTNPVNGVSWNDAQEFIKRLNQKEGHNRYRLPTEAEWELAARGGADAKRMYFFMDNPKTWKEAARPLDAYAWFAENSGGKTHPVGKKKPNPYGLYDIYGNVDEWVQDWDAELPADTETQDYRGPETGEFRIFRGGSWDSYAEYCRSGVRLSFGPDYNGDDMGFRLLLSSE